MNVSVFGIGYVGLVQGAALAEVGHNVLCVDVDAGRVEALKEGTLPLYEPGLKILVRDNYQSGRLQFGTDLVDAVHHGDVLLIAVGTPPDEDGSADLQYVLSVARTIALNLDRHQIIVDKSTVPVGTGDRVRACIEQVLADNGRGDLTFDVVSNPEFLKEGCAVEDCMRPDRIIIGTDSPRAEEVMRELYEPFNRSREKIIVMDVRSAELTKYAANCMLATKISFMNEMACLAEKLGADIEKVRHGIGADPRIGYQFIYPGLGYGGSCFPKDVKALIQAADGVDIDARVLKAVEARNQEQKASLYRKVFDHFDGHLRGKTFALWGLSFKPNTDDMREAPSRVLMEALWQAGASVQAFDPKAMEEAQRLYGSRDDLTLTGTKEAALKNADALIIVTEWQSFRAPDFDQLSRLLKQPLIFDGRNLFDPQRLSKRGFTYVSVGRQTPSVL
ncbi:UDP-glucose/GDP-mannose dehydrogenase family protein [Pseudomonas fluorescens]|uniref:UDP-glucose 6-dehydrogenase n=1 Tax=Pseudomonas fluorescens (strain Pf0-1) TaxID=205922 RepID=Q3KCE7_PSEPF|nr:MULTISPECIES: UDP-glucose/GDP-mannose dehydrogenase family protein [Pseudomonas]ABA74558.1 putative nucleotide sugar dehydrogenase [Pseudomonas fluorescens Pf0-1]MBY9026426.1 UDP-glucose/GDP-mannose dehydrogenase family protein [Pseudomonas fluorescens]MBY9030271.1 UDP-glucose/GDP-mannose dehydrogenase family protein [Pseudomonas fluorescens]MBY9038244.1 UDP-glucose/GDP-mannose dehydrogenase family protein [Pseudomonas fluorescens]MBY9044348.1 UDP-glucose/GDP-mannose dehydrogenase family pr